MRYKNRLSLVLLAVFASALFSCSKRTNTVTYTVYDVGFIFLNAGNKRLTEWGGIPEGYIEYKGSYVRSYHYSFKHDGTVLFDAVYGFKDESGENFYEEHEIGTYSSIALGPNQTISIMLPSRTALWTWEPNPRDPTGELVFRTWEKRTLSFGFVDDQHPEIMNADCFFMFYSEKVSPHPL